MNDSSGVIYELSAIIRTGMGRNINIFWEEEHLSQEFQVIIAKHRDHFDVLSVLNYLDTNTTATVSSGVKHEQVNLDPLQVRSLYFSDNKYYHDMVGETFIPE